MAFRAVARECGYEFRLLDEVMRINEEQRQRFLRKVRTALWTLRGKRLGVLGLAFKGGTDDIRESPAILLVQSLLQEGCQIAAYDPAASARAREVLNSSTEFVNDPYEAARDADALLILTEWEEFATLDLDRIFKQLKYPIVIDGEIFTIPTPWLPAALLTTASAGWRRRRLSPQVRLPLQQESSRNDDSKTRPGNRRSRISGFAFV